MNVMFSFVLRRIMDDHVANAKEPMMMEEGTTVKPPRSRGRAAGCCVGVRPAPHGGGASLCTPIPCACPK